MKSLSGIAKRYNKNQVYLENSTISMTIEFLGEEPGSCVVRAYRKNNDLLSYATYKNYKCHGKKIEYYTQNKIKNITNFDDGKKITLVSFDENGEITTEKSYKKNRLHGSIVNHRHDGKVIEEYRHGKLKKSTKYRKDGSKILENIYGKRHYYDQLIRILHFDKNNKLIKTEYPNNKYWW